MSHPHLRRPQSRAHFIRHHSLSFPIWSQCYPVAVSQQNPICSTLGFPPPVLALPDCCANASCFTIPQHDRSYSYALNLFLPDPRTLFYRVSFAYILRFFASPIPFRHLSDGKGYTREQKRRHDRSVQLRQPKSSFSDDSLETKLSYESRESS